MNLPQTAEYALRAIVWLAAEPQAVRGTAETAEAIRVPAGYLSKVLQMLSRAGLVVSTAGRKGGFRLARPASHISVLDVVQSVAPVGRIRRCPLGIESHEGRLCPLHRRLDEAIESVEKVFAATTIGELLQETEFGPPLCDSHGEGNGQAGVSPASRRRSLQGAGRGRQRGRKDGAAPSRG